MSGELDDWALQQLQLIEMDIMQSVFSCSAPNSGVELSLDTRDVEKTRLEKEIKEVEEALRSRLKVSHLFLECSMVIGCGDASSTFSLMKSFFHHQQELNSKKG